MYNKINITENSLQIISLFTKGFDKEYYIREIKKILKISPRTAQLILEDLEDKGIIESKIKGKIKLYKLKKNWLSKRYLILIEYYKEISFTQKNLLIKEVIEKISQNIRGIGIIFGSYAKGIADKTSDLDIVVAGDYNKEEIKKISRNLGVEINLKCYPLNTFKRNINKDILLKEILNDHIIFLNAEQFVETAMKNG